MNLTPIESGNRIQLPADWIAALGLRDQVVLEQTSDGILVRPCPRLTWDEIYASKLVIGSALPDQNPDEEAIGDDFPH